MKVGFRHTHCYLEIYTFKKTIKLFLGVRKDVFRSLLKSLLSRGWAMFTFLNDAMFLTIFILNVAMFWQKIEASWTKQGWNMIFHTKFRMLLDWTPLHYAKQGQPPKMFRWMGSVGVCFFDNLIQLISRSLWGESKPLAVLILKTSLHERLRCGHWQSFVC